MRAPARRPRHRVRRRRRSLAAFLRRPVIRGAVTTTRSRTVAARRRHRSPGGWRAGIRGNRLALTTGVLASLALIYGGTTAAFTSTTPSGSNSWATGSVTLSDDDGGVAMFTVSGLVPGSTGSNCITVTYAGNVATLVRLYASASSDASSLAQYVDLTVQEGTGGGFGSCTGFSATATIFSGTLSSFTTTKTAYSNGAGTWAPSSAAARTYKIVYTLNAATPSSKQGVTTTATLQWEAQA